MVFTFGIVCGQWNASKGEEDIQRFPVTPATIVHRKNFYCFFLSRPSLFFSFGAQNSFAKCLPYGGIDQANRNWESIWPLPTSRNVTFHLLTIYNLIKEEFNETFSRFDGSQKKEQSHPAAAAATSGSNVPVWGSSNYCRSNRSVNTYFADLGKWPTQWPVIGTYRAGTSTLQCSQACNVTQGIDGPGPLY